MVDPKLAADSPSRRNVLMQRMCLGDAHRTTRQAPPIALRISVMLVGCRRRLTKTTSKLGILAGGGTGIDRRIFLTTSLIARTTRRVGWNKHN